MLRARHVSIRFTRLATSSLLSTYNGTTYRYHAYKKLHKFIQNKLFHYLFLRYWYSSCSVFNKTLGLLNNKKLFLPFENLNPNFSREIINTQWRGIQEASCISDLLKKAEQNLAYDVYHINKNLSQWTLNHV